MHQPTFNQSTHIVLVETDAGITGIGEGGSPDMMEQLAGQIIGMDPFRTEWMWQNMHRAYFYPAGREKTHALGALETLHAKLSQRAPLRASTLHGCIVESDGITVSIKPEGARRASLLATAG